MKKNKSDSEIIELIKKEQNNLKIVYKKCKEYCLQFMKKMSSNAGIDDLNDIFQDAIIIFYENILKEDFVLTSSIQTYLNSVCRFQVLNKFKVERKIIKRDSDLSLDIFNKNLDFDESIIDVLEPIENEMEKQFESIERALLDIKESGGKCYELLTLFWYQKKSMNYISNHFGYTNSSNAKAQKYKCQKRLEKLAYTYMS